MSERELDDERLFERQTEEPEPDDDEARADEADNFEDD